MGNSFSGPNIFQLPVMTDDVIAISGPCNYDFFDFVELGHVIPQKTPKTLLSSFPSIFDCSRVFLVKFSSNPNITKIDCQNLMTSL